MWTNDPDRCPVGHELIRGNERVVVQCQGSIHHDGDHFFGEDHYTVRWTDGNAVDHRIPTR